MLKADVNGAPGSSLIALSPGQEPRAKSQELPSALEEPDLTAFRAFHSRIHQCRMLLAAAEEAWATYAPVVKERYSLGEQDQIRADGSFVRAEESSREP